MTSCSSGEDAAVTPGTRAMAPFARSIERTAGVHAFEFEITQRACALYVGLRSRAFEEPVAFGREIDQDMVHWNKCPGGDMIACNVVSSASGDTVRSGIPWPY